MLTLNGRHFVCEGHILSLINIFDANYPLQHEVTICRQEVPFVLRPAISSSREGSMSPSHYSDDASAMDTDEAAGPSTREPVIDEEEEGGEEAGGKEKKKKSDSKIIWRYILFSST